MLTLLIVYCKITSENRLLTQFAINFIKGESSMNDIIKIRKELSQFIENNNNKLTSDAVISKALETELLLNSITK